MIADTSIPNYLTLDEDSISSLAAEDEATTALRDVPLQDTGGLLMGPFLIEPPKKPKRS